MKNSILAIALLATAIISAQEFKLEIEVNGFKNNDGKAKINLYNTQESFMKKGIKSVKTVLKNNKTYAVFTDLPKGIYAVSMFHDENGNGEIDTNFIGIPTEGYGTSNDAKGFMGPPKYEDAKFELVANRKMVINIQ